MRFIGQDPSTQPRRNLIINGTGMINQRGYSSGTATSEANEYTLDRWRVVTSGQSLAHTGSDAGRTMTAPAGGVEQVVEGLNIVSGTYVLNWEGTATATVDGTAVTKGGTVTLSANTNATVKLSNGTFTKVQLELGSVATPFEHRRYGEELALCQRYFNGYFVTGARGQASGAGELQASAASWPPMRVTPDATFVSLRDSSNIQDLGSAAFILENEAGGQYQIISNGAGSYYAYGARYNLDAEL